MAEFTEIVKQAHRMCESYDNECDTSCPLGRANEPAGMKLCECIGFTDPESAKEIEKRVLAWAAEHPEQVYPSWYEYQQQTFPGHSRWICPMAFGVPCQCKSVTSVQACTKCRNSPIPAEIAEKLGIRPKEG